MSQRADQSTSDGPTIHEVDQQPDEPAFLGYVRGLAPGLLLTFGVGQEVTFPQIPAKIRAATPDRVTLVAELSRAGERTVGEIIDTITQQPRDRPRLVRFATALHNNGYLIADAPPARFSQESDLDLSGVTAISPKQLVQVSPSSSFLADGGHYLWFDHEGTLRLRLTPAEMIAARTFGAPTTIEDAWAEARSGSGQPITRSAFDDLVARLHTCGLLRPVPAVDDDRSQFKPTSTNARAGVLEASLEAVAEHERSVADRPGDRVAVVPVNDDHKMAPLALGLLVAYAQELDGGRLQERYDFVPLFLAEEETLLEFAERPAIFLFSNYIWNVERNLELSKILKAANPANLTIHGGPSTPKYQQDCENFFADNPHVDITVRAEGEATFAAVLDALDTADLSDLSNLAEIAGLSARGPSGVIHTEDRERITDLDTIPSPYLLGMFDPFGAYHCAAVIESNRGCPYGCTFCDWGSATQSRIRKFDLDRVKRELGWSAENGLLFVSLCDANFGILERDVDIAEHIAALKAETGYPQTAALNYAKNTMKHLRKIIKVFSDVGLNIEPTVALQSMDEHTLKVIRRSNIKLEKYNELTTEFRKADLPLAADIMMGLPGSTVKSFRRDLQKCTDRDVRARCNRTVLLPNSPMNEPSYREEHGIVAKPHEPLMETKTYTREDFDEMDRLRIAFYVFDNFGVLRHVARFVRNEVGLEEVDLYDRISTDALADPLRWPIIAAQVRLMSNAMMPPCSWGLFTEEVGRYVVEELGVEPGTALDTVLQVQRAHLPAPSRTMPQSLPLAHDFVAWTKALHETRESGDRDDWERHVPRLNTFGPGELKVSDPHDICGTAVGKPMMVLAWNILGWDMESEVARATA